MSSLEQFLTRPRDPSEVVAEHGGAAITWAQLQHDTWGLAAALLAQPAGPVGLYCADAYPFIVGLLAAWHTGRTVLLPGHAGDVAGIEAKVWLSDGALGEHTAALPISVGGTPVESVAPRAPPEVALVVFTSGSSGAPKALPKTFAQLDAEVAVLENAFGAVVGKAIVLGSVTPQHFYGLLFRVLWPLWAERPLVSESAAVPPMLFSRTAHYPQVAWVATPAIYRRLGSPAPFEQVRGKVVIAFSSGGILPAQAAAQLREGLGFAATEIFGSSETGAIASRVESLPWVPLPGVEVQRRDEDGALRLKAPHLGHADWQTMDDAIEWVPGGFRLLYRLDRVVKVEENRVALPALEAALEASPWVEQARTVLLEHHQRQLLGAAIVLSAQGRELLASGGRKPLIALLRQTLSPVTVPVALPRRWRIVDALPSDSVGKVSQAALLRLFEGQGEGTRQTQLPVVTQVEARTAAVTLHLEVDEGLAVFDGHFPEAPILAGVAQVDWAARLGRAHLAVPLTFRRLETLKFQRLIQPGDNLRLDLSWDAGKAKLYFSYRTEAGECSSGRIVFDEAR